MGILPSGADISKDQAFSKLFERHWNEVYQFCLKYSRDNDVAMDLTQNIFLSIWERKLEFPNAGNASAYLLKAAKFQVLNYLRNKKNTVDITDLKVLKEVPRNGYNPETLFISTEKTTEIAMQITALAEPTRSIFLLSREKEMSYRQIADEMDLAVKTIEKHISRALRQLRKRLY